MLLILLLIWLYIVGALGWNNYLLVTEGNTHSMKRYKRLLVVFFWPILIPLFMLAEWTVVTFDC